ncbi:NB-ARC domain-containing protein [Chroococcidiopsis sp.]|uniref:WD40 repeat domain-containing protein n=1 Tax=Chroococcidiopsis sp. TaxID=3088168 RepID=UPI003F4028D3
MASIPPAKSKRERGVILTAQGWQKLQRVKQAVEVESNWGRRLTREQLSDRTGLSLHTISRILQRQERVDRQSLECFFHAFSLELSPEDCAVNESLASVWVSGQESQQQDWGEAIDVSTFCGREAELGQLRQWLLEERCRLVAIMGIGGIGKSALAVQLARQIQSQFELVIWRSLSNAPLLEELLESILQFLLHVRSEDPVPPASLNDKLSKLMECLRSSRCLLILDNAETILHSGRAGQYRDGYEGYGQLLRCFGEVSHQSCAIVTSREKPKEVAWLEGEWLPTRSLLLRGLQLAQGRELFRQKGQFTGTEAEWNRLVTHYGGNPLALKLVAAATQELFDGSITPVLQYVDQGILIFEDIRDLLERQFQRLSAVEQEVMYWLALHREPIAIAQLAEAMVTVIYKRQLPQAMNFLFRRSLIEKSGEYLSLQPMVMEYVTERFVKQASEELTSQQLDLCQRLPLMQALAKDYVRETQRRLIVQPTIERLLTHLGERQAVKRLRQLPSQQRQQVRSRSSYAGGNIINLLVQMKADLRSLDFSEQGVWQADLRQVNLSGVNFQNANLLKSAFAETLRSVVSVVFSPDGNLLATGDVDGKIRLWQVADGKQLLTLEGHTGWVWSVTFSPDSKTIASGSHDTSVRLWDVRTGQCLKVLQGHTSGVRSVAWSLDSQTIASGSFDASIRLWDAGGKCDRVLSGHTGGVWSVTFAPSPDACILASGSHDTSVRLWNIRTGRCLKVLSGHTGGVRSVAWSPDSQIVASGSEDSSVRLWDVRRGRCLKTLHGHTSGVWSVAFAPSQESSDLLGDRILASSSADSLVRLWDVNSGQCLKALSGHANWVWAVAFSPNGSILASGSHDASVRLWDVKRGRCLKALCGSTNGIRSVSFSPDGSTLASGSEDAIVRLWDVKSGECLQVLHGHAKEVRSVTYAPANSSNTQQDSILASSSADLSVRLWDVQRGQCFQILHGHTNWVFSAIFSPDGETLATGSFDRSVRLWDVQRGECLQILQGHTDWVWSVSFSPIPPSPLTKGDLGKILASGSADASIRLWDVNSGECLQILRGHAGWVWSVNFSPILSSPLDKRGLGGILASGGADASIRLWDVNSGECWKILHGHTSGVRSIAFSPDGRMLASGSDDCSVRLWDATSGKCLQVLPGHTSWVYSVTFSPDGLLLASGSQDETIALWDIGSGQCLQTLRADRLYEGMKIAGAIGLTPAQTATLLALGAVDR